MASIASSANGPAAKPTLTIHPARTADDLRATSSLFRAYAAWLNIDLSFQSFDDELASLPGKYAPENGGEILLAYLEGGDGEENVAKEPIGCIALREITSVVETWNASLPGGAKAAMRTGNGRRVGEFKRLYVLPAGRSLGVGNALVERIMDIARDYGYSEVLLDTLPHMQGAIKLYQRHGFRVTDKYYNTDLEGTIFMKFVFEDRDRSDGRG